MIKVTLSELKSHTGKYVDFAVSEKTVYITKRGRPIAKNIGCSWPFRFVGKITDKTLFAHEMIELRFVLD